MDKKVVRVTFTYDDGSSKFVEGDELDRWTGFNMQVAVFCTAHNMNPEWSRVKWEEVPARVIPEVKVNDRTELREGVTKDNGKRKRTVNKVD